MSEQGPGGRKGKGRGKKRGGRGRGGPQQQPQQQRQQRQSESNVGGLQERREEPQEASGFSEQRQPQQSQPQQSQQQQQQRHQQRQQQPKDEQGATALPEQKQEQQAKQGQPLSRKQRRQQQRQQQQKDQTDGAGLSRPQGQAPTTQEDPKPQGTPQPRAQPSAQPQPPVQPQQSSKSQGPPQPRAQPSTQPPAQPQQSSTPPKHTPPQQPQAPRGVEKPEPTDQRRSSPPRSSRAELKPIQRPDAGGRSGRRIQLRANFLPVRIPTNKDYHHYDTDIKEKGKKSGEGFTKSEAPKIINEAIKLYERENPSGPKLVYDRNGKNVYCRDLLPGIGKDKHEYKFQFMTDNGKQKEFIVTIQYAAPVSLYDLNEALEGRRTEIPFDTMQAIEVILQQLPKKGTIQVRSSFFNYPTGREKDLGGGVQVFDGTFVSIRPTQWKMMLNVDTCATGFYKGQSVLDFMCEFLNQRDYPRRLNETQRKRFAKEIKTIKIETTHTKRQQKSSGLSSKSARDETFDYEGKKVSVLNFFKNAHNINLKYPDLPCVRLGQKSMIPIELCQVIDGQKKQRKLTGEQTQQMIRHTAIPAPDRMQKIMELIQKLHYESDPYTRDFGITIKKEMVTIQGRMLEPPILAYGPHHRPATVTPQEGSWKNTKQMLDPKELREWALISYINDNKNKKWPCKYKGPDHLNENGIDNFVYNLVDVGKQKGFHINDHPCCTRIETGVLGIDKLFATLKTRYPKLQLIVVILPVDGSDFYEEVKHCGDVAYGIITQCVQVENASENFKDWKKRETLSNLLLKINAKLGGTTCAIDKKVLSPILHDPVIVFGADVTHPSSGDKCSPSIAAVVGSKDSRTDLKAILYNAEVRVQKHRQEIIEDLKEMVKNLLKKFYSSLHQKPKRIIFYRDGVSEGQFRDVLIHELTAIQAACQELQKDPPYTPAITFLVVQKRHHARFFAVNKEDERGRSRNIPAGTVVDTQICHPTEFNFYLCSHAGIQGTSKPALYHVLYDDSNFKSDDLQILTNQLCYTYVRCARSVSIPAPAYYAHHVAFRARHHLKMDSSTEGSTISEDSGPKEVTQEMKNLVRVHDNIDCSMYFA